MRQAIVAVMVVALGGCGTERKDSPSPTVPIAMPRPAASLEDVVALAQAYTDEHYGDAGPSWLHRVSAPAVNADGTVVIGDEPIEIVFTMRRYHGPNVCERLDLTSRGWTERHDGCGPQGVDARCTAREVIARAERAGPPTMGTVALRLHVRPSTESTAGAEVWTVQARGPDGVVEMTLADDCGSSRGSSTTGAP